MVKLAPPFENAQGIVKNDSLFFRLCAMMCAPCPSASTCGPPCAAATPRANICTLRWEPAVSIPRTSACAGSSRETIWRYPPSGERVNDRKRTGEELAPEMSEFADCWSSLTLIRRITPSSSRRSRTFQVPVASRSCPGMAA